MEKGEEHVINRVVNNKNLGSGSIILMHSGAKHTASVLDKILKDIKEKGYEFVKISDLIYWNDYRLDHMGRQHEIKNIENE